MSVRRQVSGRKNWLGKACPIQWAWSDLFRHLSHWSLAQLDHVLTQYSCKNEVDLFSPWWHAQLTTAGSHRCLLRGRIQSYDESMFHLTVALCPIALRLDIPRNPNHQTTRLLTILPGPQVDDTLGSKIHHRDTPRTRPRSWTWDLFFPAEPVRHDGTAKASE